MKSTEAYREARLILAPWCKEVGFKRAKGGMLSWVRPVRDEFLVFWLQCSQDGWDRYAGSKFIVEFQLGASRRPGGPGWRHRLPVFLTEEELEGVRQIQNGVISRLPQAPDSHHTFGISPEVAAWYRRKFLPIVGPYTSDHDIWLRYYEAEDVRLWASVLLQVLPRINRQIESSPPDA